jgi:hypothetical protein
VLLHQVLIEYIYFLGYVGLGYSPTTSNYKSINSPEQMNNYSIRSSNYSGNLSPKIQESANSAHSGGQSYSPRTSSYNPKSPSYNYTITGKILLLYILF